MTQPLRIPLNLKSVSSDRPKTYLLLGVIANVSVWGLTLVTLKISKPVYASDWAIILPGTSSSTNVNLPTIGGAYSQSQSPYDSTSRDPRANYQFIATSEPVLKAAAERVKIPLAKFGKPRMKIIDNTTLMTFEITGSTAQEAQHKAFAIHQALEARLNQLRAETSESEKLGLQKALSSSRQKLMATQETISEYKASSSLSSDEQIKNLSYNVEELRKQRAEILSQQKQVTARIKYLENNLHLATHQGKDALVLQADLLLQQNLKEYNDASSALANARIRFTTDHPLVARETARSNIAKTAMLTRAQELLGRPITQEYFEQLNLKDGPTVSAREELLKQLVNSQTEQKALSAQFEVLEKQILLFEHRLKNLAQQGAKIDTLDRDRQIAQAVFSSTLASLDIGKPDTFAAYPLMQLVSEPSLPDKAISPKKSLIFAGAALGSLFFSGGLVLLWLRPRLLKRKHETAKL